MTEVWTPQRAANRLAKLAEVFSAAHGVDRFPVDVPSLAMETARMPGFSTADMKLPSVDFTSMPVSIGTPARSGR